MSMQQVALPLNRNIGREKPDLNIMEVGWDHLDREINKSKEEHWEILKEALYSIPEDN